ncbi:hypothetical protein [Nocardia cyriacigeorgica]|uniref:hypothetical protein n=1 Tax=Nocardia cyriacigeorgica TaxID=135487 RepID=UPI002454AE7D|nr:hypothetical protein [Nocardia cyriacigeorgica]
MTSTDIATVDDTQLAPVLTVIDPLGNLTRYAEVLEVAYGFAEKICRTAIVPKIYQGKPQDAAVAILHGAELGLNPLQALQNIFPVHGMPSIYAKTMVALLRQKGYRFKTHEAGPERVVFQGWTPDGKDDETSEWTMDRAVKAGFVPQIDPKTGEFARNKWDKLIGNEKYLTQPEEMLWAKAAKTVCHRLAPHILLGLAVAEDQEDRNEEPAPPPVRVPSERLTADELLADTPAEQPAAPQVQQWQPPADGAANEGTKPDTAQVDEPPVEAAGEPAPEPATREQLQRLSMLLEREGLNSAVRKRKYLSEQFGRPIGSARELTADEAVALTRYLENPEGEKLDTVAEATVVGVAEGEARTEGEASDQ